MKSRSYAQRLLTLRFAEAFSIVTGETPGAVSRMMQALGRYVRYINSTYRRTGTLSQLRPLRPPAQPRKTAQEIIA